MAFRIKTVAERTGVPTETLRSWERRYSLVKPERSPAGYRLYSDDDIAVILHVKQLVDSGLAVGEAVAKSRRDGVITDLEPTPKRAPEGGGGLRAARGALLASMMDLDRARADAVISIQPPMSFDRLLRDLLLPLAREVSGMRAHGGASRPQERFTVQYVRERICAMLVSLGGGPSDGPEAICVGAPGETRDLALLGSVLHLALRGWKTTCLGVDVPPGELAPLLVERRPALLLISLVEPWPEDERRALLRRLRVIAPPLTSVFAAGPGAGAGGVEGVTIARNFDDLPSPAGRHRP